MEDVFDLLDVINNDDVVLEFIYYGLPRQIYERSDYINSLDEVGFKRRFRLSKEAVLFVLNIIEIDLEYPMDV